MAEKAKGLSVNLTCCYGR